MKTLHLTLTKKWFDLIESGEKKEEYREIKPYWVVRISNFCHNDERKFVVFSNGYAKNSRKMKFDVKSVRRDYGKVEWGAKEKELYWVIELGSRIYFG